MKLDKKEKHMLSALLEREIKDEERLLRLAIQRLCTMAKEYVEWHKKNVVEKYKQQIELMHKLKEKIEKE